MSDTDSLRAAFLDAPKPSRRERRARATRRKALSPMRMLTQLLLVPVVTLSLTVSIYVRTSPYPREDALRHLLSMAGCETAQAMGLAPAAAGELGYHSRNDPDGDGVACSVLTKNNPLPDTATVAAVTPVHDVDKDGNRVAGGAKFLKP